MTRADTERLLTALAARLARRLATATNDTDRAKAEAAFRATTKRRPYAMWSDAFERLRSEWRDRIDIVDKLWGALAGVDAGAVLDVARVAERAGLKEGQAQAALARLEAFGGVRPHREFRCPRCGEFSPEASDVCPACHAEVAGSEWDRVEGYVPIMPLPENTPLKLMDAGLLAKANAALAEEVAELRAARDAAIRDADGQRSLAFQMEKALGMAWSALDAIAADAATAARAKAEALDRILACRDAMRAAEAEARRLGLLGEVES